MPFSGPSQNLIFDRKKLPDALYIGILAIFGLSEKTSFGVKNVLFSVVFGGHEKSPKCLYIKRLGDFCVFIFIVFLLFSHFLVVSSNTMYITVSAIFDPPKRGVLGSPGEAFWATFGA